MINRLKGNCPECGKPKVVCAAAETTRLAEKLEADRMGKDWNHSLEKYLCGGCGYWCPQCGKLWAPYTTVSTTGKVVPTLGGVLEDDKGDEIGQDSAGVRKWHTCSCGLRFRYI